MSEAEVVSDGLINASAEAMVEAEKAADRIYHQDHYSNGRGMSVTKLTPVTQTNGSSVQFRGTAMVKARGIGPDGVPVEQQEPFEFQIEALDIEGAFEKFAESAQAALTALTSAQSRIAIPDASSVGSILRGPGNGRTH